MDAWKRSFLDKLHTAQAKCVKQFEAALRDHVEPVIDELSGFLRDNGFRVSSPLQEQGRRSFKFELAENAYLLTIYRFTGVGEFELRCELFVPGKEPVLQKSVVRVPDVTEAWAQKQFREGLDSFVALLTGDVEEPADELVAV